MALTSPIRIAIVLGWLLTATAGTVTLLQYQSTSGRAGVTPLQWPAGTPLSLDKTRVTLVLFAHPKCPCTRASIEELNRILASVHHQISAHVVFLQRGQGNDGWVNTGLWRRVAAIPGVAVHKDDGGELAARFGAETSGFVVLYSAAGELLFKGGITAGRGHFGDNEGAEAIVSLLAGQKTIVRQTPVYGCALHDGPTPCQGAATFSTHHATNH